MLAPLLIKVIITISLKEFYWIGICRLNNTMMARRGITVFHFPFFAGGFTSGGASIGYVSFRTFILPSAVFPGYVGPNVDTVFSAIKTPSQENIFFILVRFSFLLGVCHI